jgi:hypothetical protein
VAAAAGRGEDGIVQIWAAKVRVTSPVRGYPWRAGAPTIADDANEITAATRRTAAPRSAAVIDQVDDDVLVARNTPAVPKIVRQQQGEARRRR